MTYAVAWNEHAVQQLLALPWRHAEAVDRAVLEYAANAKGFVRVVETVESAREFRLHVPGYYVRFALDEELKVMRIWAVMKLSQVG